VILFLIFLKLHLDFKDIFCFFIDEIYNSFFCIFFVFMIDTRGLVWYNIPESNTYIYKGE